MIMNKKTVFELLELRFEWEELVRTLKWGDKDGRIDNLVKFLQTGHKANRFRPGYDRAVEIANLIIAERRNDTEEVTA